MPLFIAKKEVFEWIRTALSFQTLQILFLNVLGE